MTKICIVTATRAEYGYLRSLIDAVHHDHHFQLQLVVTGAHLLKEQGYTVERIQEDGYPIAAFVDVAVDNTSELTIAHTMSRYAEGFADTFHKLMPDIVFVLGDRYELLPICSAAFMMKIPIAHLSGGDVTEGALDDAIRNAVTMLAEYHFPGTEDSAKNIIRMRGSDKSVFIVGEPTLDFYTTETLLTRVELAEALHLDADKRWVLMTYHPETMQSLDYNMEAVSNIITVVQSIPNIQIVITKANMDYGGKEINEYLDAVAVQYPGIFTVVSSLGQLRYLSFMKQAALVIGNSSSGIVETPFLSIPTVNVGDRQKGRYQCANIIQASTGVDEIQAAVTTALAADKNAYNDKNYWGEGRTAENILKILHQMVDKKIGGEFAIDLACAPPPISFQKINKHYLYASGRAALYAILQNIKYHFSKIDTVLLPEYLCESIIHTVSAAGFRYDFYDIKADVEPNCETILSKLDNHTCVFVINYFGYVNSEDTIKTLRSVQSDTCIILDNVQAFYEMDDTSSADYVFTSFRKWFAVPDGAWVKTAHSNMEPALYSNSFAQFKFAGSLLKYFDSYKEVSDQAYLDLLAHGEEILGNSYNVICSEMTQALFEKIDFDAIKRVRCMNADYIVEQVKKMNIQIIRGSKQPKVPFFIPILVHDRDKIRMVLRKHNIFTPVHWPQPQNIAHHNRLYDAELSLVIDQRYSIFDMKRMIGALNDIGGNKRYLE